jgi:hypothetical protein
MGKERRYIKKSADGRFFLHIEKLEYQIDLHKKTKLWLSSDYLLKESLKDSPISTFHQIEEMIEWNLEKENYEECEKLQNIKRKHFSFPGLKSD